MNSAILRPAVVLIAGFCFCSTALAQTGGWQQPPALPVPPVVQPDALDSWVREYTRRAVDSYADGGRPEAALVKAFYGRRNFAPAWMSDAGRRAREVFLERMERAEEDGLPASAYETDRLRAQLAAMPSSLRAVFERDVELSADILRFARHLAHGIGQDEPVRNTDVVAALSAVADGSSAREALEALEPRHAEYRDLRRGLEQYGKWTGDGGWPTLPEDVLLMLNEERSAKESRGEEAEQQEVEAALTLCDRLRRTGGLEGPPTANSCGFVPGELATYNEVLEQAVRRFQDQHGLLVDGIVGPDTVAALNRTPAEWAARIAANMNRWRRVPDDLGRHHVLVNIPAFQVEARDAGRTVLGMKVVAGEPETPTPVMSDNISYLDFNPYWNVPESITRSTLLPAILNDPGYLDAEHLEIIDGWSEPARIVDPSTVDWESAAAGNFPYRLRQEPGPHNALGLVKFMFPNDHAVYLHDTPAEHRFEERRRAFSHGCVRVEDPVALADFLLRAGGSDEEWSEDDIREAMDGRTRRIVRLSEEVPVHLFYFTAWTVDGVIRFSPDLYGQDAEELRALQSESDGL